MRKRERPTGDRSHRSERGIGRAVARAFAARGDAVALFARGEDGLDGAADDVRPPAVRAVALPVDVAEPRPWSGPPSGCEMRIGPDRCLGQRRVHLGLRPVRRDRARRSYRRVTEVATWLCVRHDGGAEADEAARPRDDRAGRLGARVPRHPVADAYCGAKHAIQGFHESLRCELLHERATCT